jgi:transcriptional regulator with XRE-family HTH domain
MTSKTSKRVQTKSGSVSSRNSSEWLPPYIQLVPNRQRPARDSLELLSAEPGNDGAPFTNGRRSDPDRPRDIRGCLKVLQNFAFEHAPSLTTVQNRMQPKSNRSRLTSVSMNAPETQADRLWSAMTSVSAPHTASQLARACGVSPAAVNKWLAGGKMNADNLAKAARALGVRDEWLRTGHIPRERDASDTQVDRVVALLAEMREPLAALTAAIDELAKVNAVPDRKRQRS